MLSEVTNELSNYRSERLLRLPNREVTKQVHKAMERISPGALNGLQGVDADSDGITAQAWTQAVGSAEMIAALVYGYQITHLNDLSSCEAVSFEAATEYVADRVAESILTLNGYESLRGANSYSKGQTVYVVVTTNKYGYIADLEVMGDKPHLDPQDEVDGSRIDVYEANVNGGDSRMYEWR